MSSNAGHASDSRPAQNAYSECSMVHSHMMSYASKEQRGKCAGLLLRSQLVLSAIALDLERLKTMFRLSTLTIKDHTKKSITGC